MLRSLNSGISGLRANQEKLDVIGNNIANSNTTGFKSQSVNFADNISQTMKSASSASRNYGGTNEEQIGLGVNVASISTDTSKGSMDVTNRNLDCAIDQEGDYFMVATGGTMFNESDCIKVDAQKHTMGTIPAGTSVSYTRDGSFQLDNEGNLLTSDGHRVLGYSMMGRNTLFSSGTTQYFGDVVSISRAQGASTVGSLTGSSIIGAKSTITSAISTVIGRASAAVSTLPASSYISAGDVAFVDSSDSDLRADGTNLHTLRIPSSVKEFYSDANKKVHVKDVKVNSFSIGTDGVIKATLSDGKIAAIGQLAMSSFSNPGGLERAGGNYLSTSPNSGDPILRSGAAAHIKNETAYNDSIVSEDNSGGYGAVVNGALEMSNVDLAKEFTDMIVASRAYQANSKTITTGDQTLETLVGLIR